MAVGAIGGALLYPQYRLDVRTTLEDLQLRAANGVFEIKERPPRRAQNPRTLEKVDVPVERIGDSTGRLADF